VSKPKCILVTGTEEEIAALTPEQLKREQNVFDIYYADRKLCNRVEARQRYFGGQRSKTRITKTKEGTGASHLEGKHE
jgi:hypothetical protein